MNEKLKPTGLIGLPQLRFIEKPKVVIIRTKANGLAAFDIK